MMLKLTDGIPMTPTVSDITTQELSNLNSSFFILIVNEYPNLLKIKDEFHKKY